MPTLRKCARLFEQAKSEPGAVITVFAVVTLIYLPDSFLGLYFRDEGRLNTLAALFWQGNYPFPDTAMGLSLLLAGGWQELTSSLGLVGNRLGATLCSGAMAALCYPLARRFMSKQLAVLSLIATAVVVNFTYVSFPCYRNMPALLIYLSMYCFSKYYWGSFSSRNYWLFAGSVALGLSAAAWISSLVGFAIPFVLMLSETWGSNKKERLPVVGKWLLILLLAILFWQLTAWLLGLHVQDVAPGQPILDPRHHLSLPILWEHGLHVLGAYAIAYAKSFAAVINFLIIAGLILGSWYASSRRIIYVNVLLIIGAYFLFNKYLAFFFAFCALVFWPRQLAWWISAGKIAGLLVAYKYLGMQTTGIMAVAALASIVSKPSPWLKSLVWGVLIFGASQLVGIKYWHIPFTLCVLMAGIRITVAKTAGIKISRVYLTWLAVGVIGGLATMLGSMVGPKKVEAALWLLLPLALFADPGDGSQESNNSHSRTLPIMIPIMLAIAVAMSLSSLFHVNQRESSFWLLRSTVNAPKLSLVLTTSGRANSTSELMKTLAKLKIKRGDNLLAYNNIPLLYYLTDTYPYLDEPWIDVMSPQGIVNKLEFRTNENKFPKVVVRAIADTREQNWGHEKTLYSPEGKQLEMRRLLDKWTYDQGYRVHWENKDFQVLTRQ